MEPIKRNDKVSKLIEINHLLTKSLDIGVILRTLVEEAHKLIDVADTVLLYLFDSDERVLRIAEGVGINIDVMRHIAFQSGESLTGRTYADRKSYLFADGEVIKKNMANMSAENYHYYYEGVFRRQVKSAFSVPLMHQDDCLGVLIVDNFENDGHFTDDDIQIIEVIADQSAIAIVHSNLFEDLKQKNEQLKHSIDIHKKFTKANLEGGGIDKILTLLNRILSTNIQFFDEVPSVNAKIYPIIRGNEPLGYMDLGKSIKDFNPLEIVAIEHAATALALELVKVHALYEKELHFREEVFQQMIEGLTDGELKRIQNYVNWNSDEKLVCIVIDGKQTPLWKSEALLEKERFIRSLERICQQVSGVTFVLSRAFQVVLIIPVAKGEEVSAITDRIFSSWQKEKELVLGIGRGVYLSDLGSSYQEATDAVRYGKRSGKSCVDYSRLGVERLLQHVDSTSINFFIEDKIGSVIKMGTLYLDTVSALIRSNKNHKQTAEQLQVHPNTLYQRIKKIENETGISFDREEDWLNLIIAHNLYVAQHNT